MRKMIGTAAGAIRRTPLFTPMGFVMRAILLCAAYGVCHLLGFREFAGVLSGTPPSGFLGGVPAAVCAVAYILLYFAVVLVVPVLLIGAVIFAAMMRRSARRGDNG
jgi:hypothetical protein